MYSQEKTQIFFCKIRVLIASACVFIYLDKNDKIVFLQHNFERFLLNFAHGFCLVPVSISTGEEESTLKFSFASSVLPLLLKFSLKSKIRFFYC